MSTGHRETLANTDTGHNSTGKTYHQSLCSRQSLPIFVCRLHHQLEGGPGLTQEAGGGDDLSRLLVDLEPVGAVPVSLHEAVPYFAVNARVSIRHLE